MSEWRTNPEQPNELLTEEGVGFFVSFLSGKRNPFAGSALGSDGGQAETALVLRNEWRNTYLILNGDFREEYQQAFPGLEACIEVFKRHPDKVSSWSGKLPE